MALTIAILAGGAATRLGGRDKGLELLLGRPLVAWSLDAASAMAPAAVLVIANRHLDDYAKYAPTIRDAVRTHPDCTQAMAECVDARQARYSGPLAGVATALAACATPWLLTLPVDCPDPPRELATRLSAFAAEASCDAVVAHDGERRQPLFALYRRELAVSAAAAAARGQGPYGWQDAIGARELDFADRRAQFRNLNTPEDFAAHAARFAR